MVITVKLQIIGDAISKAGRVITARVTTNNESVNNILGTPFNFKMTFPVNTELKKIRQVLKSQISSTVNSANRKVIDEGLIGKKLEFNV